MSIRLINKNTNSIIYPAENINNKKRLNRRDFLLLTALSPTLAFLPARDANAFLPFLVAVIARSIIPGLARGIARHLTKKIASKSIKTVAKTSAVAYASLPSSVQASIVEEIATKLTEDGITNFSKYSVDKIASSNAETVWAKTEKDNLVSVNIKNNANKRIETSLSFLLQDTHTRKIEVKNHAYTLEAEPLKMANFNLDSFRNLPRTGEKRIIGVSAENNGIKIEPSNKIIVIESEKLFI